MICSIIFFSLFLTLTSNQEFFNPSGPAGRQNLGLPLVPPAGKKIFLFSFWMFHHFTSSGQRCSGRNYNGRRCCTPQNPCNEGEGDCDGPGDGGKNDGHRGCKPGLVCGSNNCKKFGLYFHEKDDCCERPGGGGQGPKPGLPVFGGLTTQWAPWSSFGPCSAQCGLGKMVRTRTCTGPQCGVTHHTEDVQERPCQGQNCNSRPSYPQPNYPNYPPQPNYPSYYDYFG